MPVESNYLYIGADMEVAYLGVKEKRTGEALPSGTASWTVKTMAGTTVATGAVVYDEDSDSDYYGVIPGTLSLTEDTEYRVVLEFESEDGTILDRRDGIYKAVYRLKK
jgi:hypothetical protein